jgi:hypothetical protein
LEYEKNKVASNAFLILYSSKSDPKTSFSVTLQEPPGHSQVRQVPSILIAKDLLRLLRRKGREILGRVIRQEFPRLLYVITLHSDPKYRGKTLAEKEPLLFTLSYSIRKRLLLRFEEKGHPRTKWGTILCRTRAPQGACV